MARTTNIDEVVGRVISFRDSWNGKAALCLLIGDGPGPEHESVRIVGRPRPKGGFTVSYVKSYEAGNGNARRAYEFLSRQFGGSVRAVEVSSDAGIGFHRHLLASGGVEAVDVDLPGYDPETWEPVKSQGSSPKM